MYEKELTEARTKEFNYHQVKTLQDLLNKSKMEQIINDRYRSLF